MKRLFKVLGFIVTWGTFFGAIYLNHIAFVEGGRKVDMFGLLLVIGGLIALVKWVENKIELWQIHKEHQLFILNWKNGKRILFAVIMTWALFTIDDNLPKMKETAIIICAGFIIGWGLTLLGNIKKNKVSNSS